MGTGEIAILVGLAIGFLAIMVTIFYGIRQTVDQSRTLGDRLEAQGLRLEAKIESEVKELRERVESDFKELKESVESDVGELKGSLDSMNGRLSSTEREQARLEGYNRAMSEILGQQSHTHPHDD